MATLTPQVPAITGTALTMASVAASDKVTNPRGTVFIQVANANGSSINVTLTARTTSRPASGAFPAQTLSDNVVAVANGATKLIGPIPLAFNDTSGDVTITCSATSGVTIAAIQMPA